MKDPKAIHVSRRDLRVLRDILLSSSTPHNHPWPVYVETETFREIPTKDAVGTSPGPRVFFCQTKVNTCLIIRPSRWDLRASSLFRVSPSIFLHCLQTLNQD